MLAGLARRIGAGAALVAAASVAHGQGPRPGSKAPEISYKTLEGKRVRLSELRGHPVVVTFWATWCPPCREEFPALEAAYRRHHDVGLEVLAVNQTQQEDGEATIHRFLAEFPVSFPVLLDKVGSSYRTWKLLGLPTTVFIDSAGVIRQLNHAPLVAGELDRGLAAILTSGPVPPG
jgi:thiol-disulfide isomerase/thioredoxin